MKAVSVANGSGIRRLLNNRVSGLRVSPTVGINDISNQLIKDGKFVYKFGLGQSPFPVPSCVTQALSASSAQKDYLPAQGLLKLRENIAAYQNERNRRCRKTEYEASSIDASEVFVGPGSKELIFILQLVYYGDLVLQSPCWVSYGPQAKIIGRSINYIRSTIDTQWKICPTDLRAYFEKEGADKPRILILNYPSNPTGQIYTDSELSAIADVCREFGAIVLSDEIYSSLTYDNDSSAYTSISHYYPEGTIILDGISKWCGAGGWRLGYFIIPKQLQWLSNAMKTVASETFTSVSAPIQHAAIAAYDGHFENAEIQQYLTASKQVLKRISNEVVDGLRAYDVDVLHPKGGFYCYGRINKTKKGKLLQQELYEHDEEAMREYVMEKFFEDMLKESGVAVLPGHYFGSRVDRLCFRLSFVNFDGEKALRQPDDESLYDNIYRGVEALGQYLSQ